ncbi:MAG: hypothetical protein M1816_001320 [Peltula sp. TS41687]|nr:MAG: hypothetical protein M1816_001320 [Peltula sp. TS41687]
MTEENTSESENDSEEDNETPIESLVAGRARRATAGNRLSSLLDQEADDELELLFAEDEEDVEFDAAEDDDDGDERLESSDEDDADRGPPVDGEAEEDLEGEKELQNQARAERQAKKRKVRDAFFRPPAFRKRVKIDPTTASKGPPTPAPKPKKKLDRISSVETPTRSSSRKATVQNKEVVHARIKEHEKRRLHQIAVMEAAAKRKEQTKTKVLTQADRMAEAERTERLNSKSLNRWEATEKKRVEEQNARLAALQNRRLDGPVITWWSGMAEWVNGKLERVGKKGKDEDGRRAKEDDGAAKEKSPVRTVPATTAGEEVQPTEHHQESTLESNMHNNIPNPILTTTNVPSTTGGFLDGIHFYASLPTSSTLQQQPIPSSSSFITLPIRSSPPLLPQVPPPSSATAQNPPSAFTSQPPISPQPKPNVESTYSTHNLVILSNFDQSGITTTTTKTSNIALDTTKKELSLLLNTTSTKRHRNQSSTHKSAKAPPQEPCVITLQPARYRDPSTGLAYLDSNAYKEIQRLKAGGCQWSTLLGCYVGPVDGVARGVPERFFAVSAGDAGAAGT